MMTLILLCAAYSLSLFFRGMLAVVAPEVAAELSLDEVRLGGLASCFFISFAVAQIPSGVLLDRIGGKLTVSLSLWFAVMGIGLFSVARSYPLAVGGLMLVGTGCAPVFTGIMLFIGKRFQPQRFTYITAMVLAIGSVGDLMGTMPLALLTEWLGWRGALQLIMVITALIALCCLLGLESDRPEVSRESYKQMLKGMAQIISVRALWPIVPMFLTSYAVLIAIRGVWGGPYLLDIFNSDTAERGRVLLLMSVAMAGGTFLLSLTDRRFTHTKVTVISSSCLTLLALLMLAVRPDQGLVYSMVAFIFLGLFGFNYPLLMSHSRTFLAPSYHGRGMAVMTAFSFLGVAIVQGVSGWVLGAADAAQLGAINQYRILFFMLAGMLALSVAIYCFSYRQGSGDGPAYRTDKKPLLPSKGICNDAG
ncbi:MFS transporter [Pontibacterium granulatum]|uniref:MFS transporter n=1 Tax=Pontibacterium granulatum TaxID=2036029 RepID=UPI00249A9835|nr:MFS transporter [Pontibacterium granulatum]MDI3326576.1 MFS transporter [Pontibacterium granulatum]